MADIFISYGRADAVRVQHLVRVLEARWSVFWDRTVPPGQTWDTYIGRQLETSRCVIAIWSSTSVASEWVREEAHHGRERGVLVPVLFDKVSPPFGFRQVQAADLTTWDGTTQDHIIDLLLKTLDGLLPPDTQPERLKTDEVPTPPPSVTSSSQAPPPSIHVTRAPVQQTSRPSDTAVVPHDRPPEPRRRPEGESGAETTAVYAPSISGSVAVVNPAGIRDAGHLTEAAPSFLRSRAGLALLAACTVIAVLVGVWVWASSSVLVRVRRGEGYTDLVHAGRVEAITFSPDGNTLVTSADADGVRLWHLDDLSQDSTVIEETSAYDVAFHPRQPVLAIVQGDVSLRHIDDLQAGPSPLSESSGANAKVAFSADGQLLAATGSWVTGLWRFVDERTSEVVRVRKGEGSGRYGMALSPDGVWLAADSEGNRGMVDVWRANELDAEPTIVGSSSSTAWDVAFSRDSRLLAAATESGLHVWDMQNLQVRPQTLATTETWSVAFSPDGQLIASGDVGGTVTFWRIGETQPTSKLSLGGRVDALAFSPDGRTLAAGSFEGIVRLWPLP